MKKKISLLLVLAMIGGLLSGCAEKTPDPVVEEPPPAASPGLIELPTLTDIPDIIKDTEKNEIPEFPDEPSTGEDPVEVNEPSNPVTPNKPAIPQNTGFTDVDSSLIQMIKKDDNYMFSPLSFKYAIALLTAGAVGDTQEELLNAMGFKTMDEYLAWTDSINEMTDQFAAYVQGQKEMYESWGAEYEGDMALKVANSVWHNTDEPGTISESYKEYVAEHFNAVAKDLPANQLITEANLWVDKNTNGLIPTILQTLPPDMNALLINTLYMKSAWVNEFTKSRTEKDTFTTIDGSKVQKDFMHQQNRFRYYKDGNTQLVVLPMQGGINMAFVIGDNSNILNKLEQASLKEVKVAIPKFEVETSLQSGEFVRYLKNNGVSLAFDADDSRGKDFSAMMEDFGIHVSDIIQKTKIKLDEDGVEAAAATAVIMTNDSMMMPEDPVEFTADEPFSYYIYSGNELLFFGEYVK